MRCWICSSYSVLDDSEWLCHIIYFVGWAETFVSRSNKFNPVSVCEKNMCSSLKQTFCQIGSKPCFPDTALQRLWSGKIRKWVPLPCACLCEKPWKTWQCGPWSGMQISSYFFGGLTISIPSAKAGLTIKSCGLIIKRWGWRCFHYHEGTASSLNKIE